MQIYILSERMAIVEPASAGEMVCATEGCKGISTLRCPTCLQLELSPASASYFCSQDCFRKSWTSHRKIHKTQGPERSLDPSAKRRREMFESYNYTGPLRAGEVVLPLRAVPPHIPRPDYADCGRSADEERFNSSSTRFRVLDAAGIAGMRAAARVGREVLDVGVRTAGVGVSTEAVDAAVHAACVERDAYPSPLNYYGFPKACCTSVNEVICHGIPDMRPLRSGDILNIDITVYYRGFHADLNETITIGECSESAKRLVRNAHDALWAAIRMVKPGTLFRELGPVIDKVARSKGHSVVRGYCGHGINELFHTAPNIPHYKKNKAVGMCKEGMTFTIEPMINQGAWRDLLWPDNWSAVTADGLLSAQFEHTLLVTKDGCEVLTERLPDSPKLWWE